MPITSRFEDFPALILANDRIETTVLLQGSSIVSIMLRDDESRLNPLWNPQQIARDHGEPSSLVFPRSPGMGHFVCVDGFGPPSEDERQAGMPMHGEAHQQSYSVDHDSREGDTQVVTLSAELPLARERLVRTLRLVDGENVLYVESELENLLGFDRPVVWAEHATIGAPFLERGVTLVALPAVRSMTRPYSEPASPSDPPHLLPPGADFVWPNAPTIHGTLFDIRAAGPSPSGDHTGHLIDPWQPLGFMTFLNPARRLLLGYVFQRDVFPFVQDWEYYPANGHLARGLEFSTQPWDCPRRESIQTHAMFGAPTYRWLPARGRISAKFLVFWTRTPEGFSSIENVSMAEDTIRVADASGMVLSLKSSLGL